MSPIMSPSIQSLYPEDFAHCYGCGRLNPRGLHIETRWEEDEAVTRFVPRPHDVAVPGFVYGGLIASLIDCHAMATAAGAAERAAGRALGAGPAPRFVTAALEVHFLHPTPLGPELEIRARVRSQSERKAVVEATLTVDGRLTARARVVAVRLPATMTSGD